MARNDSLENEIWARTGITVKPDNDTEAGADLLTVAGGNIEAQGPFASHMNWWQNRADKMINIFEQFGIADWSSKTNYPKNGLCSVDGVIYISLVINNKNNRVTDTNKWKVYEPPGMGDMLKSVYDKNGDGIVDKAKEIDGISAALSNYYYGKNANGDVGFFLLPPDGDMKKSVYDPNGNGVVELAEGIQGASTAGSAKYYGTNSAGRVGFYDLPPDGDMLKSVYDTNDNGRVDNADAVYGINSAPGSSFYGKNDQGAAGFHTFQDLGVLTTANGYTQTQIDNRLGTVQSDVKTLQAEAVTVNGGQTIVGNLLMDGANFDFENSNIGVKNGNVKVENGNVDIVGGGLTIDGESPYTPSNKPTPADIGALAAGGTAEDSKKLGTFPPSFFVKPKTVVVRDSGGDVAARMFKSEVPTISITPQDDAGVCVRNSATRDNTMKFITKAVFKQWLGLDKVGNFGISHSTTGNSQTKYASESAVGSVGNIAREALKKAEAAASGGLAKLAELANKAKKLENPFTLSLKGDVSGSVSIDGSQNVSITAIVQDNSHRHTFAQIDGFPKGVINQSAYDARYLQKGAKAANADKLDGISSQGFCRAFSESYNTGSGTWTTSQFIEWLKSKGAFNQPYWVMRGSWYYAGNKILDTGVGKICFAGSVVEVIGKSTQFTIRVTTPTTSSGGGLTNAEFIYIFNGDGYSPGWRRGYNTARKPTPAEIGAESKLSSDQKRKITVGRGNPSGGSNGDIYIQYE